MVINILNAIGNYTWTANSADILTTNTNGSTLKLVCNTIETITVSGNFADSKGKIVVSTKEFKFKLFYFSTSKPVSDAKVFLNSKVILFPTTKGDYYKWSNGDTTENLVLDITQSINNYAVEITKNVCTIKEEISIYAARPPEPNFEFLSIDKSFIKISNKSKLVYRTDDGLFYELYVNNEIIGKYKFQPPFFNLPISYGIINIKLVAYNDYGKKEINKVMLVEKNKFVYLKEVPVASNVLTGE